MALPTSRDTTYAPGTPVASADLNNFQDQIIGKKHGEIDVIIGVPHFIPLDPGATISTSITGFGFEPNWELTTDGDRVLGVLHCLPGTVLTEAQAWVGANNTSRYVDMRVHIFSPGTAYESNPIGSPGAITKSIDPALSIGSQTFDSGDAEMPFTMTGNRYVAIELERDTTGSGTATNPRVLGARFRIYVP